MEGIITAEKIKSAEQCLVDNGIEPDEAGTVLQALGYILLDSELYPVTGGFDYNNSLWKVLRKHVGHHIYIASFGDANNPADVCLECEECGEMVLDMYEVCRKRHMTLERAIDIIGRYVDQDLDSAEPWWIREVLTNCCGCTQQEVKELGFDYLFPDDYCWD